MKKKWIILLALPLVIFAILIWILTPVDSNIAIEGNLSATDISEIKAAVRKELRASLLPKLSWNSIKSYPSAFRNYLRIKIASIKSTEPESAEVGIRCPHLQPVSNDIAYAMTKQTNGWQVNLMRIRIGSYSYELIPSTNHFFPQ